MDLLMCNLNEMSVEKSQPKEMLKSIARKYSQT